MNAPIALIEEEDNQQEEDQQSEEKNEVECDAGEQLSCVLQRVLLMPKMETHPQRHALFEQDVRFEGKHAT